MHRTNKGRGRRHSVSLFNAVLQQWWQSNALAVHSIELFFSCLSESEVHDALVCFVK